MRLADALLGSGGLTPERIAEAEAAVGTSDGALADFIAERQWVSGAALSESWARAWSAPFVSELPPDAVDPALVAGLPVEWARQHQLLPIRYQGRLWALASNPRDVGAQEDLARLVGDDLHLILAPPETVRCAIDRCYVERGETARRAIEVAPAAEEHSGAATGAGGPEDLLRAAEGAPITQFVNAMLLEAVKARASDVHIEPAGDRVRVRFRVDGLLYDQEPAPKRIEAALISRLKIMGRLDIAEKRLPQDGMSRVRLGTREIDIRVSTVPSAEGERMVLRLLNQETTVRPLTELGLSPDMVNTLRELVCMPQGIVLVTGPTGSGKTTTLYAALQEIDTARMNVMTIEDPIEYQLPSVSQIQVNAKIDLTFARCLRHVLRQDPDVILVGETRDLDTAEIAVRASLTGHLVFTTLHTNDAVSAPVRLMDMGVEPYLLSSSLRGVLAQRLVRRLCPRCRRPATIGENDAAPWGRAGRDRIGRPHWVAQGCDSCLEGYRGRLGIFELLLMRPEIAEAVRTRAPAAELLRMARSGGFKSLHEDGLRLVEAGETSMAELIRVVGTVAE